MEAGLKTSVAGCSRPEADLLAFNSPLAVRGATREFHVAGKIRARYGISEELSSTRGTLVLADLAAIRWLVERVNHDAAGESGALSVAQVFSAAVLDEVLHLVIQLHRDTTDRAVFSTALQAVRTDLGPDETRSTLLEFVRQFPAAGGRGAAADTAAWLESSTDSVPNSEVVLEELLLLWLANTNPALQSLRCLFDDADLSANSRYLDVIKSLQRSLITPAGENGAALLDALLAPRREAPESLPGQLRFLQREYAGALGGAFSELLGQLLLAGDLVREEASAAPPGPPGPGRRPGAGAVPGVEQLSGTERGKAAAAGPLYSEDRHWMPELVLTARNCLVWLDQLSRRHDRQIVRLDEIPEAELAELASQGFTGLWLIGIWQRSSASRRIKQLRGQPDAAASAYALYDYVIAEELGGEAALGVLRERAWQHGIRLASDMVPNHTGLDSRWVAEHPEWFVQLPEAPFPSYTFTGPDLSTDSRFSVFLEDHYFDSTDAAVVFKRVGQDGTASFIYHGNDGTSLPWNDTAQLDYLQEEVRAAVLQKILDVARQFPIIRFDAAMTLARQHVQRLWYPAPGEGGAIPSRAEHGSLPRDVFDRLLPHEFWREVVDRVAAEVPDTLLLAEAFWMMEGYFVRTLGMHRVYNSAFMNMLAGQANAEFRDFLKNILQFDPEILSRLVNFMSNPDEESARTLFGSDDRYFGAAVLLATLPGLPLFAHGQVDGLSEKYGMEFTRARLFESRDAEVHARHEREIFPLLRRRNQFATAGNFELYDLSDLGAPSSDTVQGTAGDLIAFSNLVAGEASLVVFNNRYAEVSGVIRQSVARKRADGTESDRSLAAALGLVSETAEEITSFVLWRNHVSGLEYLLPLVSLEQQGLPVELAAFKYQVLLDFRVMPGTPALQQLSAELQLRGVPDVLTAAQELELSGAAPGPLRESAGNSDESEPKPVRRPRDG